MTGNDLSAGVPVSAAWRFVAEADPGLVTAWRVAQKSYDVKERAWHQRNGEAELEYDVPTGCYRSYRKAGLS